MPARAAPSWSPPSPSRPVAAWSAGWRWARDRAREASAPRRCRAGWWRGRFSCRHPVRPASPAGCRVPPARRVVRPARLKQVRQHHQEATEICSACPVLAACGEWIATARRPPPGVWAGRFTPPPTSRKRKTA
ncbi:MAG: hypothetical protein E6R06_00285 [Mycobacterium sp.]|nr:MAG: hypothetical protein E6R06_00285 [Mycobacterium sp.]